jgi:hypothetical protein
LTQNNQSHSGIRTTGWLTQILITIKTEVTMKKKLSVMPLVCLCVVLFMQCSNDALFTDDQVCEFKAGKGGGGSHTEAAGNNLSFPVIAADGYSISSVNASFTVPYTGPYDGLTAEEIAYLEANGPWFAQKVDGNQWQAEYFSGNAPVDVTFIDWGDVIESSNPVVGRPFRLETTLYKDVSDDPMDGYTMALLANPSSPDEIQGTNTLIYPGNWATVVSSSPALVIQYLNEGAIPVWSPEEGMWTGEGVSEPVRFSFAPELNVGGKYIYGASQGGWRPTSTGTYRLTFFMSDATNISLVSAVIGNYSGNEAGVWGTPETKASEPVVDVVNNLSFVDVTVVRRR